MTWSLSMKMFIVKSKVIVTNRRLKELEKRSPHLKELVANKRVAKEKMKK